MTPISSKTDGVLRQCSTVLLKSSGARHIIETNLIELKIHFDQEIGSLCCVLKPKTRQIASYARFNKAGVCETSIHLSKGVVKATVSPPYIHLRRHMAPSKGRRYIPAGTFRPGSLPGE